MIVRTLLKFLFLVLAGIIFPLSSAIASVYTVSNTNDSGIGSLRQAVLDANANPPGPHTITCTVTGTITLLSTMPNISAIITVNGPSSGTLEITKSTSGGSAFFSSPTLKPAITLNDLTFRNFTSTTYIVKNNGGLTMNRCVFKNNTLSWLVGIEHNTTLNNCSFFSNTSCISIFFTATGFIYSVSNIFNQCTFNNNNNPGGTTAGIWNFGSKMILTNCTFANNTSRNATCIGIFGNSNGRSSAINCTFYGNTATMGSGGAIYTTTSTSLSLENCILVGNTATGGGPDMSGIDSSANGHNIISNTSGITFSGSTAGNIIGVSPTSVINTTLANNGGITQTLALIPGSPAINSSSNILAPVADQRTYSRVGNPDIGAYEFGGIAPLPVQLISFEGEFIKNKIELSWATASEINSDYFLVERSTDGDKWEPLVKIKTDVNSSGYKNYSYSDSYFAGGINYYKLSQIDLDGKLKEFPVIAVKTNDIISWNVYPTVIANHSLFISNTSEASGQLKIELISSTGQLIYNANLENDFSPGQPLQLLLPNFITRGCIF